MEFSNGNILDVIDYNKFVYMNNLCKQTNTRFESIIITKRGIIYKDNVHVFSKCKINNCKLCNEFGSSSLNLITCPKIISRL